MKSTLFVLFIVLFTFGQNTFCQEDSTYNASSDENNGGNIEVFLIDSYITPETPHKFILTYYTSDSCKSKVVLDRKYEYVVSDKYAEEHKIEIDITGLKFDTTDVPFMVYVTSKDGVVDSSEQYEVAMPEAIKQEAAASNSNIFLMCCIGGTVFLLPSPTFVAWDDNRYFSLTKEIPILSIQKMSYKYPIGYFSVEYSHIFDAPLAPAPHKNFLRFGYKHIFELPYIEYVSPGVNWFTDFYGFNGVSPEISLGFFKIYDLFTLYTKYRYNYKPGQYGGDFHEISIGVYSGFFTFHFTL